MDRPPANEREVTGAGIADEGLVDAMVAYQRGIMEAFETLYAALRGALTGYLRALVRDAGVVEDLLHETFLQLHRVRHTYQPPRPVRPWVYAIARNVFLMNRRAAHRRGRHEAIADEALPEVPVPPEIEALGDRETVQKALARLPEARREPLVLHHMLGMSFKEVGAVLGISEGAAKVRAHRALAELREAMGVPGVGRG
jgi:RNA polymerase sigma-70 factor (ECF subfamily)